MHGPRGVGTWGSEPPQPHRKAQSCSFPQEYWFGTFGKAQSYRCRPLAMRHLNDVSLASRWWPVLVAGYMFHRNTSTDPIPLLKKINKHQHFGPGLPRGNFPYPCKSKFLIPLKSMTKFWYDFVADNFELIVFLSFFFFFLLLGVMFKKFVYDLSKNGALPFTVITLEHHCFL